VPKYVYTGTEERYYPDLGVLATPGQDYSLAERPADGLWATPSSNAGTEAQASPQEPSEAFPVVPPAPGQTEPSPAAATPTDPSVV